MNNVLELKGKRFIQASKTGSGGGASMNSKKIVTREQLLRLIERISQIKEFWKQEKRPFEGILISVHYNKIVAKSNRIAGLFKGKDSNYAIVGAKFNKEKTKHIITYFLDMEDLDKSIELLLKTSDIIKVKFQNGIDKVTFDDRKKIDKIPFSKFSITKSTFKQVIADVSYIEDFEVEMATRQLKQSIITLYNTHTDTKMLFENIGIDILKSRILDNQTVFLDENQLQILFEKAPYLVSMATEDLSELSPEDFIQEYQQGTLYMPSPTIEPTVGVIDTLFDKRVYFGEWVEYHDMVDDNLPKNPDDYRHGTAVDSIIVDGARLNPWLDDGCGRFRVRHFGVAIGSKFSSFTITKQIKEIIANNKDIKVWNISLGSNQEVNDNFISAEGAILDKIQYENDVIFVVAGTNRGPKNSESIKIGAPADSLNSIVVNSVDFDGKPASYTRIGPVLSFFYKPDICYYGGDKSERITVCEPLGMAKVCGTSFAAPWITRKMAYLIHIVGLSREVAKALIIDSAAGWNRQDGIKYSMGYGIVPKNIQDIIHSTDDEIRFIMNGTIDEYETYTYNIPVPQDMNAYPFFAKATLAYFPSCDRDQGVDYTSTEMDLHFGRIMEKNGKATIKAIDYNKQAEEGIQKIYEEYARKLYRKWDNVKHISEALKDNARPRKVYGSGMWGISIKTKERLLPRAGRGLQFGLVITLKEMNGINRIDEFIKLCMLKGWLVTSIDIQNQIDVYSKAEEEIEFE